MTIDKDYNDWMCERGIEEHKKEPKEIDLFEEMNNLIGFEEPEIQEQEEEETEIQEEQEQEQEQDNNYKLPVPSYCLGNKKVDYRVLLSIINISNYNNYDSEDRYIYYDKLFGNMCNLMKQSGVKTEKTFSSKIDNLIDLGILNKLYHKKNELLEKRFDYDYAYRVNCKTEDGNNYVLVDKKILDLLCNLGMSNNELKVYIAICTYFTYKKEPKPIAIAELVNIINVSEKTVRECVKSLQLQGFITLNKNNTLYGNPKNKVFKLNKYDDIYPF